MIEASFKKSVTDMVPGLRVFTATYDKRAKRRSVMLKERCDVKGEV